MTKKDDLYKKIKEEFNVELDRKMTLKDLQDQVEKLRKQKQEPPKPKPKMKPKKLRNVVTGNEFDYQEIWAGDPDLQIIEWEEEDGNDTGD